LHLRVCMHKLVLDGVVLLVFVRLAIIFEHELKLDGLLHVEDEGTNCAGLDLGGVTSETD